MVCLPLWFLPIQFSHPHPLILCAVSYTLNVPNLIWNAFYLPKRSFEFQFWCYPLQDTSPNSLPNPSIHHPSIYPSTFSTNTYWALTVCWGLSPLCQFLEIQQWSQQAKLLAPMKLYSMGERWAMSMYIMLDILCSMKKNEAEMVYRVRGEWGEELLLGVGWSGKSLWKVRMRAGLQEVREWTM